MVRVVAIGKFHVVDDGCPVPVGTARPVPGLEREFERFLRDAGLPKEFAKAVTLHGFKGATSRRDAEGQTSHLVASIRRGIGILTDEVKR